MSDKNKYTVPSVESALEILKYLSSYRHREANISEISNALNISRSSCYRILATLEKQNFVEYDPDKRTYRLGVYTVILGTRAAKINDYLAISQKYLDEAMELTENTCVLVKRLGNSYLTFVMKSEPAGSVKVSVNIGRSFPITAGSHGKCILAYMDRKERQELISNNMVAFTQNTITDIEKLESEFKEIRQRGYAISVDEHIAGLSGVAAPVIRLDKTADMTISCIFITSTVSEHKIHEWGRELNRIASNLSSKLYGQHVIHA